MSCQEAEAAVRDLLDEIANHRHRDVAVPHGFTLEDLTVEERPNPFAPRALSHFRATAELKVPILFSPDSSSGRLRAALPAHGDNVEALRAWIAQVAEYAPAHRMELVHW